MESRQPQKSQETDDRPNGQQRRPLRFRIVKLEERIAPKTGGGNTKKCISQPTCVFCESLGCW